MTQTQEHEPIACSLSHADAASQYARLTDLRSQAQATEALDDGAAMTFGIELADKVENFATRETECCGRFLSIETTRSGTGVRLAITSDNPDAHLMIQAMFGIGDE